MIKNLTRLIYTNQATTPRKSILIYAEHRNQVAAALARRIRSELRSIFLNACETEKLVESPHVPCTVVITERTLVDGVLILHHFKPKIKEEVHVSKVAERLKEISGLL